MTTAGAEAGMDAAERRLELAVIERARPRAVGISAGEPAISDLAAP